MPARPSRETRSNSLSVSSFYIIFLPLFLTFFFLFCFGLVYRPKEFNRVDNYLDVRQALFASKLVSYAQGYTMMRAAAAEYKWNLNYGGIALMWRGGCIIRSTFLGSIFPSSLPSFSRNQIEIIEHIIFL